MILDLDLDLNVMMSTVWTGPHLDDQIHSSKTSSNVQLYFRTALLRQNLTCRLPVLSPEA